MAAKRGTDQRKKDSEGLCQHEVLAVAMAQQPVTDHDHHIANGRCRVTALCMV